MRISTAPHISNYFTGGAVGWGHEVPQAANRVVGWVRHPLFAAGWVVVRSYVTPDWLESTPTPNRTLEASSILGRIEAEMFSLTSPQPVRCELGSWDSDNFLNEKDHWRLSDEGSSFHLAPWPNQQLVVPHWLLVLTTVGVSFAPWLRWRFSLRALLIGMTVAAVLLRLVIWSSG
jgi:hypothetical protein